MANRAVVIAGQMVSPPGISNPHQNQHGRTLAQMGQQILGAIAAPILDGQRLVQFTIEGQSSIDESPFGDTIGIETDSMSFADIKAFGLTERTELLQDILFGIKEKAVNAIN